MIYSLIILVLIFFVSYVTVNKKIEPSNRTIIYVIAGGFSIFYILTQLIL